ncbi:hypothetical protein, partial [uncultured Roseibium sp.]|uniref:hypothetical protein n=1 Tax=uncultured Roseibium sp. TaxID=1936171 RepID=UPI00260945B7
FTTRAKPEGAMEQSEHKILLPQPTKTSRPYRAAFLFWCNENQNQNKTNRAGQKQKPNPTELGLF